MSKKVAGYIKLQIQAGQANPSSCRASIRASMVLILWSFAKPLTPKLKKCQGS